MRIAIIDTGVNFAHPHLRLPAAGWSFAWEDGSIIEAPGASDLVGHGTCVAALVHWLAPEAQLFALRVTDARSTTDADRLAAAIRSAAARGADIAVVALGTRTRLRAGLDDAVTEATQRAMVVVAARPDAETLPAACSGVLSVGQADGVDVVMSAQGLVAEGRPRPSPGPGRNFGGPSLSAARAAAAVARWAEQTGLRGRALSEQFSKQPELR